MINDYYRINLRLARVGLLINTTCPNQMFSIDNVSATTRDRTPFELWSNILCVCVYFLQLFHKCSSLYCIPHYKIQCVSNKMHPSSNFKTWIFDVDNFISNILLAKVVVRNTEKQSCRSDFWELAKILPFYNLFKFKF